MYIILWSTSNTPNGDHTQFQTHEISNQHKKSLSDLLTHFYPLAGRANYDEFFIDCNDEGVPFFESRVDCNISDIIQNSVPNDLNKFAPFELDNLTDISMGIQLNIFKCGGFAIGVCISHKIGDALSFLTAVNSWAAISRGSESDNNLIRPHFTSSKLFPPKSISLHETRYVIVRDRVAKRFVLEASNVEEIGAKYAESRTTENERRPSRVEALSAFIYSRFVAAVKEVDKSFGFEKIYLAGHAVNIRPRTEPPLPLSAFGNYYRNCFAVASEETLKDEYCYEVLKELREEINKIDKEFLTKFQEDEKELENIKEGFKSFLSGKVVSCMFTSLCRMPIYEADIGWGKPIWIGIPALNLYNFVVIVDKKDGDGVEVYIHLKEEHMEKLESDQEFLKYVSQLVFS